MVATTVPTRVRLLTEEQAPISIRSVYNDGDPGPIVRALAQVPEILDVTLPFVAAVLGPTSLDARTKEIVILRTSALLECRYCTATHSVAAVDVGLSWEDVEALRGGVPAAELAASEQDLALVQWVDAVASDLGAPDDETYRQLLEHWTEAAVVELTLLIGATMMLNRFATALGLSPSAQTIARLLDAPRAAHDLV